ncbi:MucR family transcriptional regulator [Paucidesulfovibrio longus]|uniref:MucR family transcriptional regulator n=1 Tax=Paucidesulfovibrio longus TaxID=889 RepID=UPI0003B42624|nr:MucR family transcriptional regulator [Paucidesulfovibrio longus]
MDEFLKEALEIAKAQAGVRIMTDEEITEMVRQLSESIRGLAEGAAPKPVSDFPDPQKAIREQSIVCLESGQPFKILTKKHLAKFGLTPDEYRAKWGYRKNQPLVCKALQRERRKRMQEMQLWKKRGNVA